MPASDAQPHPLVGKLAPDLQLETRHGRTRVAELMHTAQGVLLDLTADSAVADAPADQAGRITVITARRMNQPQEPDRGVHVVVVGPGDRVRLRQYGGGQLAVAYRYGQLGDRRDLGYLKRRSARGPGLGLIAEVPE